MILPNSAVVAVADGQRFRMLRNKGVEPHVALVEVPAEATAQDHAGSGGRHHSSAANPDASRLSEDDFAASAALTLNRLDLQGAIEHLLVIADPRTLGEIRKHLSAALRHKVVGEIHKDLAGRPVAEIEAAIART